MNTKPKTFKVGHNEPRTPFIRNDVGICPELAPFNKEFCRAMREDSKAGLTYKNDPGNYAYSDRTFAYCGM